MLVVSSFEQERKEKSDLNDEERMQKIIQQQMEEASKQEASVGPMAPPTVDPVVPESGEGIAFTLTPLKKEEKSAPLPLADLLDEKKEKKKDKGKEKERDDEYDDRDNKDDNRDDRYRRDDRDDRRYRDDRYHRDDDRDRDGKRSKKDKESDSNKKRKLSAMEEIRLREQAEKERLAKLKAGDNWVCPGLVVKVMNKKLLDGKLYGKKGVIQEVIDKYLAVVKMIETGDVIRIDQEQLETVLPAPGGKVKLVNGIHKGELATLLSVKVEDFCASVRLDTGPRTADVLNRVDYEDICKINQ
eukprot:TRINITY_DN1712_c0_g1_i2.p1 TRINITY_DN1712_c0_g1~~TRINITY_DN1712_c0_g1_i2.p1  ORF type:complete len:300 (-),score=85.37 TRINITY_DN1712_c0_g1_i2:91-990(-)